MIILLRPLLKIQYFQQYKVYDFRIGEFISKFNHDFKLYNNKKHTKISINF